MSILADTWARITLALRSLLGPGAEAETRARLLGLPAPRLPLEREVAVGGQDASRAASRSALVSAVLGSSFAQTCMGRTSNAIADTPLTTLDRAGQPVEAPQVAELLGSASGGEHGLMLQLALDLLADGNAFAELRGEPTPTSPRLGFVLRHDPGDVTPITDTEGLQVVGYRVTTLAGQSVVPPARMAHARLLPIRERPDHLLGVPPLYALLPELAGDRSLADYLASRPHGVEDGVLLRSRSTDAGALADQVRLIKRFRAKSGVWVATDGADITSLGAGVGAPRDELPMREDLRRSVILALGQPPILYGFSVTNDSAALMQVRDAAEARRDLAAVLTRALQPMVDAVATPAQRRAGLRIACDWQAELALEALAAEEQRARLAAAAIAAGADPARAYEAQGLVWPGAAALDPSKEAAGLRLVRS
jgi:hypothetical protein